MSDRLIIRTTGQSGPTGASGAIVKHGGDSSVARPTGMETVMWVGFIEPANALPGDVVILKEWTPTDDDTLELWLDASVASSLTVSSNQISQWNDISGNARHMVQATTGARPANTTTVNGLVAATFDGTDDFMACSTGCLPYVDRTYYAVVKLAAVESTRRVIIEGGPASQGYGNLALEVSDTNKLTSLTNPGGALTTTQGLSDVTTNTMVAVVRRDATTNNLYNGLTLLDTDPLSAPVNTEMVGIWLGRQRNASARFWRGQICEVLDFSSAHSADQRTIVCNYLATKWGVTL